MLPARAVDGIHGRVTAWVVLAASMLTTLLAWQASSRYQVQEAEQRFAATADAVAERINERMNDYELALRAGTGLFAASHEVELDEWRRFVQVLHLQQAFPGAQGLGYAAIVPAGQLSRFDAERRTKGQAGFQTHPLAPARPTYSSIVYLEPQDWRNARALGYDMLSEPVRRAAMEAARDSGQAALSGRVTLVQETDKDVQPGVLMYWPVYRGGADPGDVAGRQAALAGFVYAPFRLGDLMRGILGQGVPRLVFSLHDGGQADEAGLLYHSGPLPAAPQFEARRPLTLAGRSWTVAFASTPEFEADVHSAQPLLIALGGLLADVLLFFALQTLARRNEALQLSREALAREEAMLRARELRYRSVIETTRDGFLMGDGQGRVVEVNAAYLAVSGRQRDDLLGRPLASLDAQMDRAGISQVAATVRSQGHIRFETTHWRADGSTWPVEITVTRRAGLDELFVFARDLTELHRLEAERREAEAQIRRMAFHDPLTQLPNRRLLMDRLGQALPAARRTRQHGALLFIDLDHFKELNDTHGHELGDQLLMQCAERLRQSTRAEDTVARLGGDEFVLMLAGLPDEPEAARAQLRVVGEKLLFALKQPYPLGPVQHTSTPSIGATLFREQTSAEAVLREADAAMYLAKRAGGNRLYLAT